MPPPPVPTTSSPAKAVAWWWRCCWVEAGPQARRLPRMVRGLATSQDPRTSSRHGPRPCVFALSRGLAGKLHPASRLVVRLQPYPLSLLRAPARAHGDGRSKECAPAVRKHASPLEGRVAEAFVLREVEQRVDRLAVAVGEAAPPATHPVAPGRGFAPEYQRPLTSWAGTAAGPPACRCSGSGTRACDPPDRARTGRPAHAGAGPGIRSRRVGVAGYFFGRYSSGSTGLPL